MKKTAVEWLIDEIKFARNLCDDPSAEMDIWHTLDVLIAKGEEAKEMEKEQMIDWYATGQADAVNMYEQHLNKTFNTGSGELINEIKSYVTFNRKENI
jgi:predicted secreted protein